jgi:hypothetical protein
VGEKPLSQVSIRTCSVDCCDRPMKAKGYCRSHYLRHWKGLPVEGPIRLTIKGRTCSIEGCNEKHEGRGMCAMHYMRWKKYGSAGEAGRLRRAFGEGSRTKNRGGYWVWQFASGGRHISMLEHRVLMEQHLGRPLRADEHVHHKNAVRDDNRIENLEVVPAHHPAGPTSCPHCGGDLR